MKTKTITVILIAFLLPAGATLLRAADEKLDPETKARIERFEKGPKTIDVSKYPAGIQSNYNVFRQKCTLCHELSRPVNCDFLLPEEWSRYVKRMMNKPGSNISQSSAKLIYEFLVYDTAARKADKLAAKLALLTPEEKAAAEAKIKQVRDAYDTK